MSNDLKLSSIYSWNNKALTSLMGSRQKSETSLSLHEGSKDLGSSKSYTNSVSGWRPRSFFKKQLVRKKKIIRSENAIQMKKVTLYTQHLVAMINSSELQSRSNLPYRTSWSGLGRKFLSDSRFFHTLSLQRLHYFFSAGNASGHLR